MSVVVRPRRARVVVRPSTPRIVVRRPGVPGLDGSDGLSAYELAVEAGFAGTLEDWLASLVGQKGDQGETGLSGGSRTFVQGVASKDWGPFWHGLGFEPAGVQALDQLGRQWEGVVEHHDVNSLSYHFEIALAGRLIVS